MTEARWLALMRFLGFGVGMGLLPIGFVYLGRTIISVTDGRPVPQPLEQGALFLLTATTAATALGTLAIRSPSAPAIRSKKLATAVGILVGIIGILGALAYGAISNAAPESLQGGTIVVESITTYVAIVAAGIVCALLAEQS